MQESYRYWAFISYSHHDRRWAGWLHRRLEGYRVPRRLVGANSGAGAVPRRLFPIFRDRDELPSSADLGGVVQRALHESRFLIVICSRHAASSRWVNEEVDSFKRLGRESRVLCLKVDDALDTECFAPALLQHFDARGEPTGQATEPLAADIADDADGQTGATLKLVAGMIGVGYDELHRRERRRRIVQQSLAALACCVLLAVGVAGWQWQQTEQRAALAAQALQVRIHQLYRNGRNELLDHNETRAAVLLDAAYRLGVDTPPLRFMLARAMRVVDAQQVRIATGAPVVVADIDADGTQVLSVDDQHRLRLYDVVSGMQRVEVALGDMDSYWAAYSPRGTLVWVDSDHLKAPLRRLRLFDAGSGELRAQYEVGSSASGVAMPPVSDDDRRIAFVAPDRTITLATLGGVTRHLAGPYSAAGFCRGQDRLLAARSDGTVELRDARTAALRARYEGLRGTATMMASNRNCGVIAAASASGAVRVWDTHSGDVLMSGGHTQAVTDLRLNDDGSRLMSLTRSAVGVWNGLSGGLIYASRFLDPSGNLAMLRPDGRQLALLADGRLSILDPRSSFELYSLDGHDGAPIAFAFDQTNQHLLSGGGDGDLLVWKLPQAERAEFPSSVPQAEGAPLALSPDGAHLFVGARDGGGALWRGDKLQRERLIAKDRGALTAAAFSADSRWLATTSTEGAIDLSDLSVASAARVLRASGPPARLLAFGHAGRWLAASLRDGHLELFDLQHSEAPPIRFERDQSRAYAFAPHEDRLAIGAHGDVRLWDLQQRRWRWQTRLPASDTEDHGVGVIVFSPDGDRLLATDRREHAYLLDANDGHVIAKVDLPASGLFTIAAFSHDGRQIIIGDWSKCAWLWRLADQRVLALSGHTAAVRTASFSHDGALALTAGDDGVIKIWDADSGDLLESFGAHDGAIAWDHAQFSADDQQIFSSGTDGYARLWPVAREIRSAADIAALLRCRAPWRVEGAGLVARPIEPACGAQRPLALRK